MSVIRDISVIETPPEARYPVQTFVLEYTDGLIVDAVTRELSRGGQVYIVYNRVQSMDGFARRLSELLPEASILTAHGQMPEGQLERTMLDFMEHKADVLLCSTIIESGLDIPNANTLIVIDADRMGLAQLYQLRGRVGRSTRLGYAYLTVQRGRVMNEKAHKRNVAVKSVQSHDGKAVEAERRAADFQHLRAVRPAGDRLVKARSERLIRNGSADVT